MPKEIEIVGRGVTVEFPDEMSDDQIRSVLRRKFPPQRSELEKVTRREELETERTAIQAERGFLDKALENIPLLKPQLPQEEPEKLQEGGMFTQAGIGLLKGFAELGRAGNATLEAATRLIRPQSPLVQQFSEAADIAGKQAEEYEALGRETTGPEIIRELASTATSIVPTIAVAPGGLPVMAGAAALQSFGSQFADTKKFHIERGLSDTDAATAAYLPALASGLVTGLVTRGFGATGVEGITQAVTSGGFKTVFKDLLRHGGLEATEEQIDQIGQAVIQKMSNQPDLSFEQAFYDVSKAGGFGFIMGGGVQSVKRLAPTPEIQQTADRLRQAGAPATAMALETKAGTSVVVEPKTEGGESDASPVATVPERYDTILAQIELVKEGKKPSVLIPEGQSLPARKSHGLEETKIPGTGTFLHTSDISSSDINEAVRDKRIGILLGYGISEKPANPTAAVSVIGSDGSEKISVVVDPSTEPQVKEALSKMLGEGDTLTVVPMENVIKHRLEGGGLNASQIESSGTVLSDVSQQPGKVEEAVPAEKGAEGVPAPVSGTQGLESGALGPLGMGAAKPGEFRPGAASPTSIKNAKVDQERQERGLPPMMAPARRGWETVWDEAMAKIDAQPETQEVLIAELKETPRALSDVENALLLHRQVDLKNEYSKAARDAAMAYEDGRTEDLALATARVQLWSDKMAELEEVTKAAGTEQGRGLAARKMMANEDFTLATLELQKRAANEFRQLTVDERAELQKIADDYKAKADALEKRLADKDARIAELESQKTHTELVREERVERVKRAFGKKSESTEDVTAKIKAKFDAGEGTDISGLVQQLARQFVAQGVTERNALIDAVHGVLQGIDPNLTRRQTMDAISGYGDFRQLSKDEVSVQLRDLKGQMQQIAKLEDMQAGQAPQKTGVERRTPSDEERRLIKQVEEAKKKGGYKVTDPATQLRSALQAIETRLTHQIADLEHEIATKTRIVREKGVSPTSPEIDALRAKRDALKGERDALFGKRELTDEQRVRMATAAVERSIAELEERIGKGDIGPRKAVSKTPETPELAALRARREALQEQLQEMRDIDESMQAAKAESRIQSEKESLEKAIAEQERRLMEGDIKVPSPRMSRPADPRLEVLKQRRDELSKQLVQARKKPEAQKAAERLAKTLKDLNDSIAERERRVSTGDISPVSTPSKVSRPMLPELEQAKQRLEELNRQLAQIRRDAKPKKTPDERATQAFKTRTKNRIAELEEKLAAGDFSKKAKRPIPFDKEAADLKHALDEVKRKFYEQMRIDQLKRRNIAWKVIAGGAEALNLSRALITSLDFSAVLRQGGFIVFGHPIRAVQSFPAMLKAMVSPKMQARVMEEIRNRPNYDLYNQSRLYLAEETVRLSQLEEAYMSRWAEKVPLVAATQRAYTTFLNKLRADSFDSMAAGLTRSGTPTPDEAKAIANYINVATGRGSLKLKSKGAEGAANLLNTILFSPRYLASRFQLLGGQPLYGGTFRTRKMIAAEYARFLGGVSVVYGLAALMLGDDDDERPVIELDPRSSDFGKIRVGNTRIDPLTGLLQITVLVSRVWTGKEKKLSGEMVALRGEDVPYRGKTTGDVLLRFGRTKLSPSFGTIANILANRKDLLGQPVTLATEIKRNLVPISYGDIYEAMQQQGVPKGTALAILSIFGMGVQTYEERE